MNNYSRFGKDYKNKVGKCRRKKLKSEFGWLSVGIIWKHIGNDLYRYDWDYIKNNLSSEAIKKGQVWGKCVTPDIN